jgi:phage tail sheath protein FI
MDAPDGFDAGGGPEALVAFQGAALRLAAARGDLVMLLTLPVHYRSERALAHVAGLAPAPGVDARSFAALYHPWLGVRDESGRTGSVRFLPPDGAVAGMAAARTLARGAWLAPANVPLRDIVALEPRFDGVAWERLLAAGVNLVRPGHAGFHLMSAETLASGALRPLNVRRLLILLRRLALREGPAFAFESNSDALRRRLRLRFERFLTRMFERGAFAGSRPAEAFDVRTDAAVNPPESVDRGRLVVELRVAPSRPLAFLTVRLVQRDGAGLIVVEG